MKIRTVKKVVKESLIKGRKTPLSKRVTLDHVRFLAENGDHKKKPHNPEA